MNKRIVIAVVAALGLAGVLAACGSSGGGSSSSGSGAAFNAADVTFTQGMIPHHQQAVEMAKMADMQASSSKVKDLASRIDAAQGPEIKKMQGWLKDWGKDSMTSTTMSGSMSDNGTGMGMMSEADMKSLGKAQGADFDKMFLTMMITHHQGAIAMAKTELKDGKSADAKSLAQSIISGQQREITEMEALLANG